MRKNTFKALTVLGIFLGLTAAGAVLASSYEWLTNASYSWSYAGGGLYDVSAQHKVNTSATWHEYRSFYLYATNTDPGTWTPPANWPYWWELTECRRNGFVTGSTIDKCDTQTQFSGTATGTWMWIRSTTNYAGCGTYTSTPNVASCGDYKQGSTFFIPAP